MLFGASGAGKTTLLECVSGLLTPDHGRIAVGQQLLFDSESNVNLGVAQRRVAYVFQTLALFPHMSVEANIAYGLNRVAAEKRRHAIAEIVECFRIDHLRHRRPAEISGGERQRTALARALVTEPRVLLLDEPLSALDAASKSGIIADLRSWNRQHQIPVLYVTHSREELFSLGERVIALENGRIAAVGSPQQVLHAPRTEALAQAAGFENIFDATVASLHPGLGTMTCKLPGGIHLEVPLGGHTVGDTLRVALRAGDILVASSRPDGLSARNLLPGHIESVERRDVTVIARVTCTGETSVGAGQQASAEIQQQPTAALQLEVHLTPGAIQSLGLAAGREVWLVIKTYSCHLLESSSAINPTADPHHTAR